MRADADSSPPPPAPSRAGVVPALLAAALFGVCAPFGKRIFEDVGPLLAGAWSNVAAGLAVSAALLVRPGRREDRLTRADAPWLVAGALLGSLAGPWAFFVGLSHTEAHVASAMLYLEAPLTAVLATLFFGERLGSLAAAGTALVAAGGGACALAARSADAASGDSDALGAAWIALACLFWALDTNCLRRFAHRDALRATRAKCLVGGGTGLVLAALLGAPVTHLAPATAAKGALFGALGIGASVALFVGSLRRIGAARAAAVFGTYPVIGIVVSVAVFGERPSPWVLAAAATMAAGVFLVAKDVVRARERADAPGSA